MAIEDIEVRYEVVARATLTRGVYEGPMTAEDWCEVLRCDPEAFTITWTILEVTDGRQVLASAQGGAA